MRTDAWLELNADGVVVNMVVWDGVGPYNPPNVAALMPCHENPGVTYGWQLVDGQWVAPSDPLE